MSDPLKEFIDQHRPELDTVEPSAEIWTKIETNMNIAATTTIAAKSASWLKYFAFGASIIAVAVVYSVTKPNYSNSAAAAPVKENIIPAAPAKSEETNPSSSPGETKAPVAFATIPPATETQNEIPKTESEALPEAQANSNPPQANENPPASSENKNFTSQSGGDQIDVDTIFQGITRLEINCTSLDATIKGHAGTELKIKGKLNAESSNKKKQQAGYRITYTRKDTVLQVIVSMVCKSKTRVSFNFDSGESVLRFDVPEKINLTVNNTYGHTSIADLRGNELEIRSSSGDVTADNIHSNPRLYATYGDITARNIYGNLHGRSSSGNATVINVSGNVDLATTYGDQKISQVNGTLKVTGSSGNIFLTQVTGDATVTTTYGDISLDGYKGTPRLVSSSGSIKGVNVELTGNTTMATTYGDIEMTLVNQLDALSFELVTTYGEIVIDKNGQHIEQEKKLSLQKGTILIKATSSSGSQRYR